MGIELPNIFFSDTMLYMYIYNVQCLGCNYVSFVMHNMLCGLIVMGIYSHESFKTCYTWMNKNQIMFVHSYKTLTENTRVFVFTQAPVHTAYFNFDLDFNFLNLLERLITSPIIRLKC